MKRNTKTLVAAMIVVATTAAFMVGCSKKEDPNNVVVKQGEATLDRIMDFKHQLEAVETNPDERSVSYMSITDAVWNLEALFNLTYAFPDESYGQTVSCDTTLYLPVCANDSVSLSDLSVFYDRMFVAVQTLYQATDLDNKQFLILDVEAGELDGNLQAVTLHTVQGSLTATPDPTPDPQPWRGPFTDGLIWYYGKNGGTINGLFIGMMDAADTLTRMLNTRLVPKAPENCQYQYTHVLHKVSTMPTQYPFAHHWFPNLTSYCEFYRYNPSGDDYWLDPDLMNFHYYGECQLVQMDFRNGNDPIPSTHSLFRICVDDYETDSTIGHKTEAYYGVRLVVAQEWGDREPL